MLLGLVLALKVDSLKLLASHYLEVLLHVGLELFVVIQTLFLVLVRVSDGVHLAIFVDEVHSQFLLIFLLVVVFATLLLLKLLKLISCVLMVHPWKESLSTSGLSSAILAELLASGLNSSIFWVVTVKVESDIF